MFMAQKIAVVTTDDIDGSGNAETVTFGFGGFTYEIDLNEEHRADLDGALAPYLAAGRRVRGRRRGVATRPASVDRTAVRSWAKASGLRVSDRGRISAEIMRQYEEAH